MVLPVVLAKPCHVSNPLWPPRGGGSETAAGSVYAVWVCWFAEAVIALQPWAVFFQHVSGVDESHGPPNGHLRGQLQALRAGWATCIRPLRAAIT